METSGEIGERESVTISVTIVMNISHHKFIGDANEDCVSKAGAFELHCEPFTNRDCAVEAG